MNSEILNIYFTKEEEIKKKLTEFDSFKKEWNGVKIFRELSFCILTPQSKARNAWKAIENLSASDKLLNGNNVEIAKHLNIVRFKNNKAKYLVLVRDMFFNNEENKINLNGIVVEPKMKVERYDFSSHAGKSELLAAIKKLNPEKVICVHGDKQVMPKFKKSIEEEGFEAIVPRLGEEIIV